jgi:hypothetical protein
MIQQNKSHLDITSSFIHMTCPGHFIFVTFITTARSGCLKDGIIQNYLISHTPSSSAISQTFIEILLTEIWEKKQRDETNKNVILELGNISVHRPVICVPKYHKEITKFCQLNTLSNT